MDTYINGGGPRHSKYYRCIGSEQRLSDCDSYTDTTVRTSYSDVGMDCNAGKSLVIVLPVEESICKTARYCTHESCYISYTNISTVSCNDGEVRLDGGVTKWEGRVEVCFNQRWNIVGGEEWSETNSHVMCNVLGYDIPGKYTV